MSTLKSSAENLTLNADGSGNDIKFQSNATEVAAIDQAGNLTLSGTVDGVDIQTLNTAVTANTAKTGITSAQASAITANTAKVTNSTSASDLTSGTLPMDRLSGTLPALNGSALTGVAGRKNLIINGGMNVWQRATTFTGNQAGFQGADRWKCTYQDAGAIKQERVDYTSSTGDIYNSMKLTCTTSGSYGNSVRFQYNLETADVVGLRGKTVTASAYVKQLHSDSNFHNFGFQYSNSATDYAAFGSWTASSAGAYTSSLTVNSFVRISRTYTVPNDARSLCFFFDCQSDTGNTNAMIEIANIQLELGSTATDFEYRSYGEELALCQRYYERFVADASQETLVCNGLSYTTTRSLAHVFYLVEKRVKPTFSLNSSSDFQALTGSSGGWQTATGVSAVVGLRSARLDVTGLSGLTASGACEIRLQTAANGAHWFAFDAEL